MDDHDWDDCGDAIADLFQADEIKAESIRDAWYNDLDDEEMNLIHDFVCESKRSPEALETVQRFEKYAEEREKRMRKRREENEKIAAHMAAKEKAKAQSIAGSPEFEELQALVGKMKADIETKVQAGFVADATAPWHSVGAVNPGTITSGTCTAMSAADIRYKTENAW